jgi:hypothetical protein
MSKMALHSLPELEETVECLLEYGADPNLAVGDLLSPWACTLSYICALSSTRKLEKLVSIFQALSLSCLRLCELLILHGAYPNTVIYRPAPKVSSSPCSWVVDPKAGAALSALAVVEDFIRAHLALVGGHHSTRFAKMNNEIRDRAARLVNILRTRGAVKRQWVGGKQTEGPPVKTPLSFLVKQSDLSNACRENDPASSNLESNPKKGFRESFRCHFRASSRGNGYSSSQQNLDNHP